MKKGRPCVKVSVLCEENKAEKMKEVLFRQTTTFGVRSFKVQKTMLERRFAKIETSYGEVTVKEAYYKGKKIKSKLEYGECKKIADNTGIPIREIYEDFPVLHIGGSVRYEKNEVYFFLKNKSLLKNRL